MNLDLVPPRTDITVKSIEPWPPDYVFDIFLTGFWLVWCVLRLPLAVTYQSGALKNEVGISKPRFFVQFSCKNNGVAGKSWVRWGKICDILLRNVTYKTLLQTLQRNCSPLRHLGQESIRHHYKDEDGDFVNISPDDSFAFSEMLRTAKQVGWSRLQKNLLI